MRIIAKSVIDLFSFLLINPKKKKIEKKKKLHMFPGFVHFLQITDKCYLLYYKFVDDENVFHSDYRHIINKNTNIKIIRQS